MANKNLFTSPRHAARLPATDAVNEAGGVAYRRSSEEALAQYAMTGCLNATFYAAAATQLTTALDLAVECSDEFVARLAVYARQRGYMKDLPAMLLAMLSWRDPPLFQRVFEQVIDNGKMLRTFVQIMRSGAVGRNSLGSGPKRAIVRWLDGRSDAQLFADCVGNDPSIADVIKMVHPKPKTASRRALYGYVLGRPHDYGALPEVVREFETFKRNLASGLVLHAPNVPFRMLTGMQLPRKIWIDIARSAKWQTTRMNLNTFARHGVLEDHSMVRMIAKRLSNREAIAAAKAFPYQLMAAHANVVSTMPNQITRALRDAMELALDNVPRLSGGVWVLPDISGSMHAPVTGYRSCATTKVRCIDVAALIASAICRRNRNAQILPFHDHVVENHAIQAHDPVLTSAQRLASLPSGGTRCAAPLEWICHNRKDVDLIVFISDNESWIDGRRRNASAVMEAWTRIKGRNRDAKMVCIDIQSHGTVQAPSGGDVINVGGFSDAVFDLLGRFAYGGMAPGHWVADIERVTSSWASRIA